MGVKVNTLPLGVTPEGEGDVHQPGELKLGFGEHNKPVWGVTPSGRKNGSRLGEHNLDVR